MTKTIGFRPHPATGIDPDTIHLDGYSKVEPKVDPKVSDSMSPPRMGDLLVMSYSQFESIALAQGWTSSQAKQWHDAYIRDQLDRLDAVVYDATKDRWRRVLTDQT